MIGNGSHDRTASVTLPCKEQSREEGPESEEDDARRELQAERIRCV